MVTFKLRQQAPNVSASGVNFSRGNCRLCRVPRCKCNQQLFITSGSVAIDSLEVSAYFECGECGVLTIESVELDLWVSLLGVPGAYPFDQVEHLVGIPGPEVKARQGSARIAISIE